MKVTLVGMNNPLSVNPMYALWPDPVGCTGHRIYKMLQSRVPDVTMRQYVETFTRRNLLNKKFWDAQEARRAGMEFTTDADVVVVLGREPHKALGLPAMEFILPIEYQGIIWRLVPHPSGRSLWYNSAANKEMVSLLLEELYMSALTK